MQKIKTVTAFVSEDATGEGIMAFLRPDGIWIPMVAADEERMISLYPHAVEVAEKSGVDFKVLQFTNRNDITEEIKQKYGNSKG